MKSLIKINIAGFFIYFLVLLFNYFFPYVPILKYARSLSEIFILLVFGGINSAALIGIFLKKDFDRPEFLNIASISALVIIPLLLALEFSFLGTMKIWLPFFNVLVLIAILLANYFFNQESRNYYKKVLGVPDIKKYIEYLITTPVFWIAILYSSIIFVIFRSFYSLPDLDPYYWLSKYSEIFNKNQLVPLSSYRPLFASFSYLFVKASHIDIYAYFKYVLPFISVLSLIPAWLIAREFRSKTQQIILLSLPFISSVTILYSQASIPQSIFNLILFYFIFFLAYSWLRKDETFYFLAGLVIFTAFFYYEAAVIFFLFWLIPTVFFYWKKIICWIKNNKFATIILLILGGTSDSISEMLNFIYDWITQKIFPMLFSFKINFLFPFKYTNIDGNAMGWNSGWGVIKYYLFYMGPAVFVILLSLFLLVVFKKQFRDKIKTEVVASKELILMLSIFLFFFFISEILPRFFNIAFLPERAWIFGGIFALPFIFPLFKFDGKIVKFISYAIILGILLNIGGALYVNNLKKNVTTPGHLESMEWIKKNLPQDRFFFSYENKNLLNFHGASRIKLVGSDFYTNFDICKKEISTFTTEEGSQKGKQEKFKNYLISAKKSLEKMENMDLNAEKDEVTAELSAQIELSKDTLSAISIKTEKQPSKNLFIYYATKNEKDPYLGRPYYNSINITDFIFDNYPERFQRVYSDLENNILIWKIL